MKAVSYRIRSKSLDSTNNFLNWCASSIFARGAEIENRIVSPSRNSRRPILFKREGQHLKSR